MLKAGSGGNRTYRRRPLNDTYLGSDKAENKLQSGIFGESVEFAYDWVDCYIAADSGEKKSSNTTAAGSCIPWNGQCCPVSPF